MNDLPPHTGADAAAALLERARAGDSDAFGELYLLEVDAARRLARILVGNDRAEELVAESFAKVLAQLDAGRGPTDDFRAYLHVTIRNGYRDAMRATTESPASDQPWLLDDVLPPVEDIIEDLDRDVAVSALATLPRSWQQVLWHLEVEGRKPAEVATLLDMDAGAVSSLAYRAREGLKRAYLDQHLPPSATAVGGQCGWTRARMSQHVRGDLSARAGAKVDAHLDECDRCSAAYLAVDAVNQKLALWLFPVVLWGITGAKKGGLLWFAAGGGAAAGGSGGSSGGSPTAGPNPLLVGAAATVAAAGVIGGMAFAMSAGGDGEPREAGQPAVVSSAPGSTPPAAPPSTPDQAPPPSDQSSAALPVIAPPPASTSAAAVLATSSIAAPASSTQATSPTSSSTPTPTGSPTTPTTSATPTTDATSSTSPTDTPTVTPTVTPTDTPTTTPPDPVVAGLSAVTVTEAPDGNPARGPFEVTVAVTATGDAPAELEVHLDLDDQWLVSDLTAGGDWQCGLLVELGVALADSLTCTHDYDGAAVPPLVLRTEAPLLTGPAIKPRGTATLAVDGVPGDPGAETF